MEAEHAMNGKVTTCRIVHQFSTCVEWQTSSMLLLLLHKLNRFKGFAATCDQILSLYTDLGCAVVRSLGKLNCLRNAIRSMMFHHVIQLNFKCRHSTVYDCGGVFRYS